MKHACWKNDKKRRHQYRRGVSISIEPGYAFIFEGGVLCNEEYSIDWIVDGTTDVEIIPFVEHIVYSD